MDLDQARARREAAWLEYGQAARYLPDCEHVRRFLTGDKKRPALDRINAARTAMCEHVRDAMERRATAWYRFRRASEVHERLALAAGVPPYA